MSHEITETDGLALAESGAWHGLGKVLPRAFTPAEGLREAGLGWTVEEGRVFARRDVLRLGDDGLPVQTTDVLPADGFKATIRSDTGTILGVVGENYHVVQNRDLAALILDVAGTENVRVESAGSFRGGRDVFFCARLGSFNIGPRDESMTYALFTNSHDGTGALRVLPTAVRVVCANTRRMALAGAESKRLTVSLRHSSGLGERMDEVRAALRGAKAVAEREEAQAKALAAKAMGRDALSAFFSGVYVSLYGALPKGPYSELSQGDKAKRTRAEEMAREWNGTLAREMDVLGMAPSAWLAANAVTRWMDHDRIVRGGDRMFSNVLGSCADAKDKVYAQAVALLG